MSLEEKLNQLNKNLFGKRAKEIRFDTRDIHYLEDDYPPGGKEINEFEQAHDMDE